MAKVKCCEFEPGQVVRHRLYDYRGLIYDIDPQCKASEAWYDANPTQPERDQPWYHVLVDGADHTTYVAESNLVPDDGSQAIQHPWVSHLFSKFVRGRYFRRYDA